MKFYFIRHGKTQWNVEKRFQGANGDSPLVEEAVCDLKKLGDYLKDVTFDKVFSSDLKRAVDTCNIIMSRNNHQKAITLQPLLREWSLGKLEGQKIDTMKTIYPQQMKAFYYNLSQFNNDIFDAESVYHTTQRIKKLVKSMEKKQYNNVLLVGHGANLTASIRKLLGDEIAELRNQGGLDNGSLTILKTNNFKDFTCLTWNDTSYKKRYAHHKSNKKTFSKIKK